MPQRFGECQHCLFFLWGAVFLACIVALVVFREPAPEQNPDLKNVRVARGPLKVFRGTGKYYAELNREKAIEFGLEKLYSTVNYLLLAAAAVLGFCVKAVMDASAAARSAGAPPAPPQSRLRLLSILHAGFASGFSIFFGVFAYFYLAEISVTEEFCLTGAVNVCFLSQIGGLVVSAGAILVALTSVVRDLLP